MYSLFDPNVNGVKGEIIEIIDLATKYGIGGVSVPVSLFEDEGYAAEVTAHLREKQLKWGMLPTSADFYNESLTDDEFAKALQIFKRWASAGEKMGIRYCYNHVWSGSNVREEKEQREWVIRRIKQVWEIADDHGILYGMEFLGPGTLQSMFRYPFYRRLSQILSLADEVSPRCGFLFDTYHWYCGSDQSMEDVALAAANIHRMSGFHLNDAVAGRAREEQQDMERHLPLSTGVIHAEVPYRAFMNAGYEGPVLCEPFRPWVSNAEGRTLEETIKTIASVHKNVELKAMK